MLIPGSLGIDAISQLKKIEPASELCIVDETKAELQKIIKTQSLKHRKSAEIALGIIKKLKIPSIKTKTFKNVDETIMELARDSNYGVATQDTELRQRLKRLKTPLFILRQKKYILRVK